MNNGGRQGFFAPGQQLPHVESVSEGAQASVYPNLTGKKLLLVEDNPINREIALEILGVTGAQIDTAENGREAVERFTASPEMGYSLILMDVQMPVMKEYKRMLPVEQVELYDEVLRSLDSVAICIDASEWEIPEDGWYNATHLTKEASVEFTRQLIVNSEK